MSLEILSAGPQTLIEDLGRPGLARLGVGASGAFDRGAAALANRLVGNPRDAALLEVLLGGLRLRTTTPVWVAVTGAGGELGIEPHTATPLDAGAVLEVGPAARGVRWYVAVRGGIAGEPVLGSLSRDTLAGLGPRPLRDGDLLDIGTEPSRPIPSVDALQTGGLELAPLDSVALTVDVRPGPRRDRFAPSAWDALGTIRWTVDPRSDRTGIRLSGGVLEGIPGGELPSEGMVPGAIQVSPDGAPTILGPDAPVTGGYPVIGVVAESSFDALAQVRPGQTVRLRPTGA